MFSGAARWPVSLPPPRSLPFGGIAPINDANKTTSIGAPGARNVAEYSAIKLGAANHADQLRTAPINARQRRHANQNLCLGKRECATAEKRQFAWPSPTMAGRFAFR